jgi:ketosteroid isomerase-like protein
VSFPVRRSPTRPRSTGAYEFEPVGFTDAGEHVVVELRERGRVERTGVEVEEVFSHSFVLLGGKVVEWHMYDSHAEALAAVGLSE